MDRYRLLTYRRPDESTANEIGQLHRDEAIEQAEAAARREGVIRVELERWCRGEWRFVYGCKPEK